MSQRPVDDKAHIRHELDLGNAEWTKAEPEVEYAFVPHTDGVTYVALRRLDTEDSSVLVFTTSEWDAFVAGLRDGQFDLPSGY